MGYFVGSVWGGGGSYHFYTLHEDGEILAFSARDLVGVLVVVPGPCGSLGLCSKRWGGVPKVGMVFQNLHQNPPPPPPCIIAVWLVALRLVKVVFKKLGWCSKSWDGVPKICTRTPTLYYRGLIGGPAARLGVVPKVAPEPSPYMVLCAVWLVALRLGGVVF